MKKLFLIDDNKTNQREAYGASYVDEGLFNDVLIHIEQLNAHSDLSFLNNAACVMIHDSLEDYIDGDFDEESHKARTLIEEKIQDNNTPYIIFSDGHDKIATWREDAPNVVYSIKKSEFYLHLSDFIQSYIDSGKLDMRIIAYGKDFIKKQMSDWHQKVFSAISELGDNDFVGIHLFGATERNALRQIIEKSQPKIGVSFNDVMCGIEDEEVSAGRLRLNLNNIINSVKKYGKNICSWKQT
jgi:hypothetical protein